MSKRNKPISNAQENPMSHEAPEAQDATAAQDTLEEGYLDNDPSVQEPEVAHVVAADAEPVQEPEVAHVVNQKVTDSVQPVITNPQTPEQAYTYLLQSGTPLQKSVLETVDNFIDKNSGPFQYGLVTAVSSQAQLLQALLQVFKKEPRNTSRMLWSAIIYKAYSSSSQGGAFSERCVMVGTQHWKWGKDSYATYAMLMNLISHMASAERKDKVKDYVSRAAINRLQLDQEQRDGLEHILAMYGV